MVPPLRLPAVAAQAMGAPVPLALGRLSQGEQRRTLTGELAQIDALLHGKAKGIDAIKLLRIIRRNTYVLARRIACAPRAQFALSHTLPSASVTIASMNPSSRQSCAPAASSSAALGNGMVVALS